MILKDQGEGGYPRHSDRRSAARKINIAWGSRDRWQKRDQFPVELLGSFLVRQVSDTLECDQAAVVEIPAQSFGRATRNCPILCSPHQQSRIITDFRQRLFQFGEICCP